MLAAKMVDEMALDGIKAIRVCDEYFEAGVSVGGSQHGVEQIFGNSDATLGSAEAGFQTPGVQGAFDLQQDVVPAHYQLRVAIDRFGSTSHKGFGKSIVLFYHFRNRRTGPLSELRNSARLLVKNNELRCTGDRTVFSPLRRRGWTSLERAR